MPNRFIRLIEDGVIATEPELKSAFRALALATRMEAAVAGIAAWDGAQLVSRPLGGVVLWVRLPDHLDDEAFTRLALQLWPGRWIEQPLRNPASRALPPAPLATNVPQ